MLVAAVETISTGFAIGWYYAEDRPDFQSLRHAGLNSQRADTVHDLGGAVVSPTTRESQPEAAPAPGRRAPISSMFWVAQLKIVVGASLDIEFARVGIFEFEVAQTRCWHRCNAANRGRARSRA